MPAHNRPALGFLTIRRRSLALASLAVSTSLLYLGALPATATTIEVERFEQQSQDFEVTADVEEAPAERDDFSVVEFTPVQWPVDRDEKVSSHFGYRAAPCGACSSDHQGVDWTPGDGTAIPAIAPGTVVEVGNPSGALGVYAIVEHVVDGDRYRSVYGHMQHGSLTVAVGDTVELGDQLGRVGNTGTSTGVHLHFGILGADNRPVDPITWLEKHATE
ncbi:M23 family metallopeptidase [Lysobacter korlensis]|uniref:M23 family metallopeptidase n=1 Tax=Lysobacter korlensis TaxID=553636 RepID=A0ABV6RN89_9GAMM